MKKAKTPECVMCQAPLDDRLHFGLQCPALFNIRSEHINKFVDLCPSLTSYLGNTELLLMILLDPFSPAVPAEVRNSWIDSSQVYDTSRNYFFAIHNKREKFILTNNDNKTDKDENEDTNTIVISLYEKQASSGS